MSRIGRKPVLIPPEVTVATEGERVSVVGPKGTLAMELHPRMRVAVAGGFINVHRSADERQDRALHGLTRTLLANMVEGVTKGFERRLELVGIGYRASVQKGVLVLHVGYSHPIIYPIPDGIDVRVESQVIVIFGINKQLVGQVAATIRGFRKPDSYKGKGIRYVGERLRLKPGKTAAKG